MKKLSLSQYRALPLAVKNAMVDRVFYKKENPSGRDYINHTGNALLVIISIHDLARERQGKFRELWFEMGRYLCNPYRSGSSLSRLTATFINNPRNIPGLLMESYFLAIGEVTNDE